MPNIPLRPPPAVKPEESTERGSHCRRVGKSDFLSPNIPHSKFCPDSGTSGQRIHPFLSINGKPHHNIDISARHAIDEYISEVAEALRFLVRAQSSLISDTDKLELLTCFRQVLTAFFKDLTDRLSRMDALPSFCPEAELWP